MAGVMSVPGYDRSLTQLDTADAGGCVVCDRQLYGGSEVWLVEDGPTCSRECESRWEIEHWAGEYVGQLELLTERWEDYRVTVAVEGQLIPIVGTVADVDRVARIALFQEDGKGPEKEIGFDSIERIEVRRARRF